jgi:5-methylcytosine-specific restriction endonuclease McrA
VGEYMSRHRNDDNITELKNYFTSVIDWVSTVFDDVEKEMKGLEWGRLYKQYHNKPFDSVKASEIVKQMYGDPCVKNRKGIFEYILGGCQDSKLLEVRMFDDVTKKTKYHQQKKLAEENKISNCPLCAVGHDSNKTKIWKLEEMDADHVSAWSKGGATSIENCEMLCKTHNRAKGNK